MIVINENLSIPDDEVRFEASRSSGPGGQHVNKTETRVTLVFDLRASTALTDPQRMRIEEKLATRVSGKGILRVTVQKHRSQRMNRDASIARFAELLAGALAEARPRRATRPSRAAKAKRIDEKKHRGSIKKNRSVAHDD